MVNFNVDRPIYYEHDLKYIEITQFDIEEYFQ